MVKNINDDALENSEHWIGNEYSKISVPQYTINFEFLNRFSFSGNEKVLDIGCGSGKTTQEIALKVPNGTVLGIDASSSMIETACHEYHDTNLQFKLLNAQKINFTEEFNIVTCFFCMQWVQNKALTIKKIFDALKSNGKFFMIVPMPHPDLPNIRNNLIKRKQWKNYFEKYADPLIYVNDTRYEEYIKKTGLKQTYYQVKPTPLHFTNYTTFFKFMSQMTPHLNCLPSEKAKEEFMLELIEMYSEIYPPSGSGIYELIYNLLKVSAYRSTSKN